MAKDPAVLFYISSWLTSTAGMDSDARGWYLNLMLHNYDKGGLKNDVEILAQLAGVRFSEFERFKQVLEQVLMQKFKVNEETGLLENPKTMETLQSREIFKDKRVRSGNIGVVIKLAKTILGFTKKHIETLKEDLYSMEDEKIEEAKNEQVLKQMLKLYINKNVNKDISINSNEDILKARAKKSFEETGCTFETNAFKKSWLEILGTSKWLKKEESAINKSLKSLMKFDEDFSLALVDRAIAGGYQGLIFENTQSNYEKYLREKNQKQHGSSTTKEQSRAELAELATRILTSD